MSNGNVDRTQLRSDRFTLWMRSVGASSLTATFEHGQEAHTFVLMHTTALLARPPLRYHAPASPDRISVVARAPVLCRGFSSDNVRLARL